MSKPNIIIHNLETNEVIERPMTDDEYNDYLEAQKPVPLTPEEQEIADLKASANSKLEALGLTPEEIAALRG